MKIVRFNNGMYAIRRGIFFKEYMGLDKYDITEDMWWTSPEQIGRNAMTSDLDKLKELFKSYRKREKLKEVGVVKL